MCNETGDIWIVFNGEIWNYKALRQELLEKGHRFRTDSDTETIVHAYEEYGVDCIQSLHGMFGLAIENKGLNTLQLNAMMTVKPQTNTQLIELDVQNNDPHLAAQLANEVGQSFIKYANSQLPGTVQMLPAQVPGEPIKPQPSHDAGIGALIGLGLALTLMFIFEWIEDRPSNPDEVQELLGMDLLAVIPQLPESQRKSLSKGSAPFIEKYRMLAASLNSAQAINPYKFVMITSALAGEGKSTVAANLASSLAMTGKRVLLMDANLRHPVLDQRFQVDGSRGLSNVFIEMWT